MKTLTQDGLEWIKHASIDMNIRIFNNKVNNILDKSYPLIFIIIIVIIYLKYKSII